MIAFATARTVFKQLHEWMPSQRAVLRIVDAIGALSRTFLEQEPAPVSDGEIVVIEVDAVSCGDGDRSAEGETPRRVGEGEVAEGLATFHFSLCGLVRDMSGQGSRVMSNGRARHVERTSSISTCRAGEMSTGRTVSNG